MRIKINFSKNTRPVSIANQSQVNGYIHKCLGIDNKYHDAVNNYAVSSLMGGRLNEDKKTVSFDNGGYITVSSSDTEFMNKLVMGILNNQEFTCGMNFAGVDPINETFINGWNHFATLSPFLIKEKTDNGYGFVTLNDDNFEAKVKSYLLNKLSKIDPTLNLTNFNVKIPNNPKHKVKKILVKNVINHANQCHLSINCDKRVAELLYNIGVGQSTGSGFGTVYNTRNHNLYR
jgi:CRISPR-associated endoribonuclease Cas6